MQAKVALRRLRSVCWHNAALSRLACRWARVLGASLAGPRGKWFRSVWRSKSAGTVADRASAVARHAVWWGPRAPGQLENAWLV